MSDKRKAFNFDLDNEKLEEFYPSPSGSKTSYNNAWSKIQKFMEANGFEHRQYSGYESVHGMSDSSRKQRREDDEPEYE